MTMAHVTNTSYSQTGLVHRVAGMIADLKQRYAAYRVYRTTLRELQQLSTRELADLGLSRSEIRRVAYHAAYH